MSSPVGRALLRDVFSPAGDAYPVQCAGFTWDHLTTIAKRAKARGEPPFDVNEVIDHVVAPIVYHILFDDREPTLDYGHVLLERVRSLPAPAARSPPADPAAKRRTPEKRKRQAPVRAPRLARPKRGAKR
jgi:hypothetical protein